ncbi:MAG: methyltransferase [Lachnospiraceae bacterium]|nr:methyltransferase [Lachnospiraceae bacterium]
MYKILVDVYVPSLLQNFEFFIPLKSRVDEVTALIRKAIEEMTDGMFFPDSGVMLCDRESGEIFNINLTVEQIGLKEGSRLMLM